MGEIKWLHLSDLHHRFENFKTDIIRDSLIRKVDELRNSTGNFDFLAITGDIAYKGVMDRSTVSFIKAVMTSAGVRSDNVFIVPGNHDIRREEGSNRDTLLNDLLYKQLNPSEYITHKTNFFKRCLLSDQRVFFDFYENFREKSFIMNAEENIHYVEERDNYNILNINTSWLCTESKDDSGRLVIGKDLLYQALKNINRSKPTFALGHHTLSSLSINEQNELVNMFHGFNVDIYMCGHVHEPFFKRDMNNGELQIITSGAAISDGYAVPGFTTGELNIQEAKGKIRYYKFNSKLNEAFGFWSLDYSIDNEIGDLGYKPITIERFKNKSNANSRHGNSDINNAVIAVTKSHSEDYEISLQTAFKYEPKAMHKEIIHNEKDILAYSALFDLIAVYDKKQEENIFSYMLKRISESTEAVPFHVKGSPGTGKTILLCLLYFYLKLKYKQNSESPLPIYIDSDCILSNNIDSKVDTTSVLAKFKKEIKPLVDFIAKYKGNIVLIVDGIDGFVSVKKSIYQYINYMLEEVNRNTVKRIIGISTEKFASEEFNYGHFRPQAAINLNSIRADNENVDLFIDLFDKLYSQYHPKTIIKPNVNIIKHKIKQWKIRDLDIFILNLLYTSFEVSQSSSCCGTLVEAYRQYCKDCLMNEGADVNNLENNIDKLSALAYECSINNSNMDIAIESVTGILGWNIIYKHFTVRDYLVARFIANNIKAFANDNKTDTIIFEYIYPHQINKFFKGIINESQLTQQTLLSAIYKLSKGNSTQLRSMAVFIAGRLTSSDCKRKARQYLEELKGAIVIDHDSLKDMEKLFYYRCIYVSLICLGDRTSLEEYIDNLLKYSEWNEVNRGFHLEYYGDIDYILKNKSEHKDSLDIFKSTYDRLKASLLSNVNNDRYLLWNLELFTLCSLVQNRGYDFQRCGFLKDELQLILNKASERSIMPERLKVYIQMFKRDMDKNDFDEGYLIDELYALKDFKRRGWTKRGLVNTESVADHLYGVYLLGMTYLPESKGNTDYNKNYILQMVLVHDLAEAYIGDLTPDEKTIKKREEEQRAFQILGMASTYEKINYMEQAYELWLEYEEGKSINAKVAREIDRLDSLVQLYQYKIRGCDISDFNKWKEEIEAAINTDYGEKILGIIELHYSPNKLEACSNEEEEKNVLIHWISYKSGRKPKAGDILKISKDEIQGLDIERIKYIALTDSASKSFQYIAKGDFKELGKNVQYPYIYQCTEVTEFNEAANLTNTNNMMSLLAISATAVYPMLPLSAPSNYYGKLFSLREIRRSAAELHY